jgi:hypothetical protein
MEGYALVFLDNPSLPCVGVLAGKRSLIKL